MMAMRPVPAAPIGRPWVRSLRVSTGLLIGSLGDAEPLDADRPAGQVHHHEHVLDPAVLLADQVADRAALVAEGEYRGRAGMDAELVLERHAVNVVGLGRRAVLVDEDLRHHEQRDPLDPRRCIGRPRQHQMNDVVRQVMIAIGDEDLLAGNQVMVASAFGPRAYSAQVRAGLRFRQVHRSGPLARDHFPQEARLQLHRNR